MTIIFPLTHRKLNLSCQGHISAGRGCANDFEADYEYGCSPVSGQVFLFHELGGGDWMRVTDEQGRKWEMAHLSQRLFQTGDTVIAGQKAFVTGGRPGEYSSGTTTTGPHLHLQIIMPNGQRIDPWPLLTNVPLFMEGNFIRNESDGSFAFVRDGKKMIVKPERAGLAALTAIQRKSEVINVTQHVWDSLPAGSDF